MDAKTLELSDKGGVAELIRACYHFGMEHVVISPGSRNAPLTISFVRSGLFRCHSIADERAAAFYALGLAAATQKPVAVVCTSGSAAANLAPAMAEAFYARTPLIAITADRPLEWTNQGNGQTINQTDLFRNFCTFGFNLHSEPVHSDEIWFNRRKLSELFHVCTQLDRGPAHINVPLREPLYGSKTYEWKGENIFYGHGKTVLGIEESEALKLKAVIESSPKLMILVGQSPLDTALTSILQKISSSENAVIITETTANLNLAFQIDTIDRILIGADNMAITESLYPDLLITLGGSIVSKKAKAWLRQAAPKAHWHVHPYDSGLDTFQNLSLEIKMEAADFLVKVWPDNILPSDYRKKWLDLGVTAKKAHDGYVKNLTYSDFSIFRDILASVLPGTILHSANSSAIRYIQFFGNKTGVEYQVNRGTSGIDGSTSTAAGWATALSDRSHLLISGDVAFLYDSNALWNDAFPKNLKIVVINNGGGGIFRLINGSNDIPELERFFETNHQVNLSAIARAFAIPFHRAQNQEELTAVMPKFFDERGSAILEIQSPRKLNAPIFKDYFAAIRAGFRENLI